MSYAKKNNQVNYYYSQWITKATIILTDKDENDLLLIYYFNYE